MKKQNLFHHAQVFLCVFTNLLVGKWHLNGRKWTLTVNDAFAKYCVHHLPSVGEGTRIKYIARMKKFLSPLGNLPLAHVTPDKIADHIAHKKWTYKKSPFAKRFYTEHIFMPNLSLGRFGSLENSQKLLNLFGILKRVEKG